MKQLFLFMSKAKWAFLALFCLSIVIGCDKDDPDPVVVDPIASFQSEVSADNFLLVNFTNFSKNADSYSWDFGDDIISTEETPSHTYAAAGTYTITLEATGNGKTVSKSESITLSDPDAELSVLAGTGSKTWYLQREGIAVGLGPNQGSTEWWSFGGVTPLGDRPCILDDKYIFHKDGTFEFDSNGTIFVDSEGNGGWFGPDSPEGCFEESDPATLMAADGQDLSAFASGGSYTYEYDPTKGTLSLSGLGAYIGLANKVATGDSYVPTSFKEYSVFNLVEGDVADSLQISIVGDPNVWSFYLVSYKDEANLPAVPSAMPSADFSYARNGKELTFNNLSTNATNYSWDFGDGMSSTEVNPVHTYASDGQYDVVLTASDDSGNSVMSTQTITISDAVFSAATMSSAEGKLWMLAGEASFKVGPMPNSGEWWPGLDAQGLIDRACIMDDAFTFFDNGEYTLDVKGDVYAEAYMGGTDACLAEGDIPAEFASLASGTHNFEVIEAAGDDPAQIKVTGEGAYFGFSKPFNGGEYDGVIAPKSEITYDVLDYSDTGDKETLTLLIDINGEATAFWTITMESVK